MPRATIDREETFRYDLRTLPSDNGTEGGYVVLRRLSYHQMMTRRDMISKIAWEERRNPKKGKRSEDEIIKAALEVSSAPTMEYEFKHSIVQHNLEDGNGTLLDFSNPESFRNLDPRVGAEIGTYIDNLNQEADEEELENFPTAAKPSYGEERTPPNISEET